MNTNCAYIHDILTMLVYSDYTHYIQKRKCVYYLLICFIALMRDESIKFVRYFGEYVGCQEDKFVNILGTCISCLLSSYTGGNETKTISVYCRALSLFIPHRTNSAKTSEVSRVCPLTLKSDS